MPKAERMRVVHKLAIITSGSPAWVDARCGHHMMLYGKEERVDTVFSTEWEHVTCKRCLRARKDKADANQ